MPKTRNKREGIALLAVLLVILAITLVSLSYISRSDGELAYGQNLKLHVQAASLAESGLEQAKALILNPQDTSVAMAAYWTGAAGQQLGEDGLYYDVSVQRHSTGSTQLCSFDVLSTGYRLSNGQRVAESTLAAELRLDPCICLWLGGASSTGPIVRINGDVYCGGAFTCERTVNGDVYAAGAITGNSLGQKYPITTVAPVAWPPVTHALLAPTYYVNGASHAAAAIGVTPAMGYTISPSAGNPAGVAYYAGNLELSGFANITGTLVVSGDLTITGPGNTITATKNFPALVVGGRLIINDNSSLTVNGLAVISRAVEVRFHNLHLTVNGGLFAGESSTLAPSPFSSSVTITADHSRTALLLWDSSGGHVTWRQAGSAFFKNLRRQP
jgi:hypothetical protein